ncbi:MAG: hypothetical protein ACRD3E_20175 [Terriglobales bacterium]
MRIATVLKIMFALAVVTSLAAFAQKSGGTATSKYDTSKEVTVKGVIDDIKELPVGKEEHVHLMLKTATETVEVRLCPTVFLKDFDVAFEKGQQIEVTGSRVKIDDQDVILAREVVNGNSTVVLRDKSGAPVWTWMKKD